MTRLVPKVSSFHCFYLFIFKSWIFNSAVFIGVLYSSYCEEEGGVAVEEAAGDGRVDVF